MQQLDRQETECLLGNVRRSLGFGEGDRRIGPKLVNPYMDLTVSEGEVSHSSQVNNIDIMGRISKCGSTRN